MSNENVYKIMQEEMIKKLEEGVVPWRRTWSSDGMPRNAVTNRPYRGFNVLWLACQGFSSPHWLTFKQCKEKKGKIKKGAKSTVVLFWKVLNKKDDDDKPFSFPMCRYYRVWNIEQTEGITLKHKEEEGKRFDNEPIENCEEIVRGFKDIPKVESCVKPVYRPTPDIVGMPDLDRFETAEEYYSTLFHELGHSTMHSSRLSRDTCSYAKEELVAEMTACFLCAIAGIETQVIDNQASYIASWMKRIKEDVSLAVLAAGAAQRASDYILNNTFDENGNMILPPLAS